MNDTNNIYITQKKFCVTWLRETFNIKKEQIIEKKRMLAEKKIEIFRAKDALTTANIISYFRIIFALFIIISLSSYNKILIITIYTAGLITDWLDGIITEANYKNTKIGKIVDPTTDKILIIGFLWNFKNDII